MSIELDHVFVCTAVGAPEAEALTMAGFTEGAANVHPGQGTACRRFFFHNAYLELFWVHDEVEAQAAEVAPTRLWERWRTRASGRTCPFGIGVRPTGNAAIPFATWSYRPMYLPDGEGIPIATNGDALHEPMLFVIPSGRRPDAAPPADMQPLRHENGVREVTRLALDGAPEQPSEALAAVAGLGLVELRAASQPCLVLGFDDEAAGQVVDLSPTLPLVLRW